MKNFTSLLMAVAAWLFATVAVADSVTITVSNTATNYADITTGYYVVKAKAKGNAGLVYHTGSGGSSFRIRKGTTDVSAVTDSSYIWYITKTENGLVFQNASDGAYLPATSWHGGNFNTTSTLANAAVLQSASWDTTYTGALENGFTLKQMNYNLNGAPLCIHANDYSSEYALSYWENGTISDAGTIVMFAAYSITSDFTSANITKALATKTVVTDNTDNTATTTTTYKVVADGSTYSNIEASYYYSVSQPESLTVSESNASFTTTIGKSSTEAPFELSTADNPVWYTVKFRNSDSKYLVHQTATDNNMSSNQSFKSFTDWTKFTGSLWAFVKSGYGVKVLCKQTGTYLTVANGNNTTKATLSANGTTLIVKTNSSNSSAGFSLKYPDVDNAYIGDHVSNTLGVWNNGSAQNDGGSAWTIEKADASTDIITVGKTCFSTFSTTFTSDSPYLLTYTKESVSAALSEANAATTIAGFDVAYNKIFTPEKPVAGAYYRIICCNSINYKYITSEDISVDKDGKLTADNALYITRTTSDGALVSSLWAFDAQSDGTYHIRNANNGGSWCNNSSSPITLPIDESSIGNYSLFPVSGARDKFYIKLGSNIINAFKGNSNYDDSNITKKVVMQWNDASDAGGYWYIEKVDSVPVAISAAKYASVCLPFAVKVSEESGVKAYYTKQLSNGSMVLTEIEGGIIPANCGAILYHDGATTVKLAITTTDNTLTNNKLSGATACRTGFEALSTYVLALDANQKVAFCKSQLTEVPANKAYLLATNVPEAEVSTSAFSFDFGKVDGIGHISAEEQQTKYFDLNGRAVLYPVHGIYVTNKGQKVLFP